MSFPSAALASAGEPLPPWFPLLFVGLWLFISTGLAFLSGHMLLLSRFPPVDEPERQTFRFASGSMRWVSYHNALRVGIGARGLHLSAFWLFRPVTHRGIPCIPWRELRCTRPQAQVRWYTSGGSRFEVLRVGLRFRVYGRAGRAIEAALRDAAGTGVAPPAGP